jgi:hypothetical protein
MPDLEMPEEIDGAAKQSSGPIIAVRSAPRYQRDPCTRLRDCDRCGKAGGAAADRGDVVTVRCKGRSGHELTIDVCADVFNPRDSSQNVPGCLRGGTPQALVCKSS